MAGCYHQYNDSAFWGRKLEHKNIWQGVFEPCEETRFPIFVNSTIADRDRGIASCDWASYPNAHALLGFLQYVYLPTAFYSFVHPQLTVLHTPIGSTDALCGLLRESGDERAGSMVYFLQVAQSLWSSCEYHLMKYLFDLGEMISNAFSDGQQKLRLDIYASAPAICCRMQQEYWCEQVFYEDTGVDLQTVSAMCRMAQEEPLYRGLLVEFLNSRAMTLI